MKKARTLLEEHRTLVQFHDRTINALLKLHEKMPEFGVGLKVKKRKKTKKKKSR